MTEYNHNFSTGEGISKDLEIAKISTEILLGDEHKLYMPNAGGSIIATPIVHRDVVYIGSNDSVFYAISIDGQMLWDYRTGGQIVSNACIDNDTVYFTCYDGYLYALGLDGKLKWKYNAGSKIVSSPIVYKGVVYFGDSNGTMYAICNNKLLWKYNVGGEIEAVATIHKDVIYFGSFNGKLYALSLDGGKLWEYNTGEMIISKPTIYEENIYFPAFTGKLHCIDLNGKERYKINPSIVLSGVNGPSIYKNKMYFCCTDGIYCIELTTKKNLWKVNIGDIAFDVRIYNDVLYAGSSDNNLYAIDSDTGKVLWKFDSGSMIFCVPSVYRDRILFGSWDGKLFCISKDGKKIWSLQLSTSPPSQIISYTKKKSSAEIVIEDFKPEEFKVEIKKEENVFGYGSFSTTYIEVDRDYTGKSKSDYLSGKSNYTRKKRV